MKKTLSIVLALLLVACAAVTFVSCKKTDEIVLRVLENDTAKDKGYLDWLLNAFNEKYASDGVKAVDANMDEYSNLEENGPYGYGPDVLYQANDILMKYVKGKHILPIDIDKLEGRGQIPQNAWDAYKAEVEGRTVYCGIPVNVQQPLLYYRKDMLPENWRTEWDKNNNSVPDMTEFWTEMYYYSKTIREADSSKFGFAVNLTDQYFNSGFLFSYGAYVFGNNNTNDKDIGMASGDAKLGAKIIWDLAGLMDLKCADESFTNARTTMLAKGTIFANICTPDITTQFLKDLALEYKAQGMSESEAEAKAQENLVVTALPKLPKNGDITTRQNVTDESLWMPQKTMGGINGYGISSYSEHRDWALKFVEFATSAETVIKRQEMLGIVPARADALTNASDTATTVTFANLNDGTLVIMPSISSVRAIWAPIKTCYKTIATDGCGEKTFTADRLQAELENMVKNIKAQIETLQ